MVCVYVCVCVYVFFVKLCLNCPFTPSLTYIHTHTHTNKTKTAAALHVGRSKVHLRLPDLEIKLPHTHTLHQALTHASKLFSVRRSRWANLQLSTYMSGLTCEETHTLTQIKTICKEYSLSLVGDLPHRDAWRKYGTYDTHTHAFEFFPGWFLAPVQMRLDFLKAFVGTQVCMCICVCVLMKMSHLTCL